MTPDDSGPGQLDFQIETLRHSLAESERAWVESGFAVIRNPVAESIRADIERKIRQRSQTE